MFIIVINFVLIINMLHIPKIDDYWKILTDEDVKDFIVKNFSKCSDSIREEQNYRKVTKLPYIFLTTHDEVEKYVQSNSSDNCAHLYNVEIFEYFWSIITTD